MSGTQDPDMPRIDLMNFEDPQFEDGKYVLTSPRSLEACSRIGVKPVDLLYKSLAEFQEELLPQDVPLRTIYNIYDEHEQNRERKLATCRDERSRIMDEEKGGAKTSSTQKPPATRARRKPPLSGAKTQKQQSRLRGKRQMSKSVEGLDAGSLQRQRTAWATSIGHERISHDEINERVKELNNESMKLRKELISRKEKRGVKTTEKRAKTRPKSCQPTQPTSRPASARPRPKSQNSISRSYSASDLSLAGSSMLSRSGTAEARPVTNSKLRKALKSARVESARVTPRDEKILELMMVRHEDEEAVIRERKLREIQWERQKAEEEAAKMAAEMRRRRMLAEEARVQQSRKRDKSIERQLEEQQLLEEQERTMNDTRQRWRSNYTSAQKQKSLQASEKVEKEQLRKRIQETNVAALEREEEELKSLVKQKQDHQLMTAAQKKEARLMQESLRVMMNNRSERRQFEDRWNSMLKDTQDSINALEESMKDKNIKHKSKYEQIQQRRENEITLSRLDREKRALQAKLAQQQHENEMEEWRDNITTSRELSERHAQQTLARSIERKARKAHEERVAKEKIQKQNIKKIHKDIDDWKKEQETYLQVKDRRSDLIMKEKDFSIRQSRDVAASSMKLRDTLRNKFGGESFDQKAFKAELYNKFEAGTTFFSAEKNNSHVKFR